MRVIALFGRGNIGKTRCLGHLINLIYRETEGYNRLFEGQDMRITLDYMGHHVAVCTWGDNEEEEQKNLDYIQRHNPDIAILATRTKGRTVELVEEFCDETGSQLKWVEKFVASFDDISGQEYLNNLQAEQILDYVRGLIRGQLYYVDSITAVNEDRTSFHVSLFGTENQGGDFPRTLSFEVGANALRYQDSEAQIREDDFVLYRPDSEHQFYYGNETPEALVLRSESRNLREELARLEIQDEAAEVLTQKTPDWVKSYHVKVGHGNCSLILTVYGDEYELWMVDSSTYDFIIRRDYRQNLYQCLKDIAATLNKDVSSLRISRFMLTHTHFDHYNGLLYLINLGLIDDKTLVYVNLHYDCASPVWTAILKALKNLQCRFVEPVYGNQTIGLINIYHPECRICKSGSDPGCRIVPDANNSSVVYGIDFCGRIMVLPGDLEQDGFKSMSSVGNCSMDLFKSDFYIVSHHGSINGHPDMPCMNPSQPIPITLDCVSNALVKAILMGRDGAFSGIYSPVVVNYWRGAPNRLEITEMAPHYLELDWRSGNVIAR